MSYSTHFWNAIAGRYARSPVAKEDIYQLKLAETRRHLRPDMRVLEFGCGTGSTALVHAPHVHHYTAIDVSRSMLKIAKGKLADTNIENLEFQQSAIEEWTAPSESYDLILGLSILHLLNDPDAAIEKAYRMLKPGGLLVTSTVCIGGKMPVMRIFLKIGHCLGLLPKLVFFERSDLEKRINQVGFKTEFVLKEAENTDSHFLISAKTA
ncbi:MAG: class I SAM-dependent methyltransferase [Agarilytica sp.]